MIPNQVVTYQNRITLKRFDHKALLAVYEETPCFSIF